MAGLAVSVKQLTIRAWDFFPAKAGFAVGNPTGEHVAIKLAAEGDGAKWLTFNEQNLVLAPNETKPVDVRVLTRSGGTFHPVIIIRQQALEGPGLGIATGIKLPVEIHSRAITGPLLGATFILLLFVMIKFLKKNRFHKT